jgi:hypothetical protein
MKMCISYLQVSLLVLTGDRLVPVLRFGEELLLLSEVVSLL